MKKSILLLLLQIAFSLSSFGQSLKTDNKPYFEQRIGFGFGYAPTTNNMNFEIIYGIHTSNFKVGMTFRPGNPRGKAVSEQLPNYGLTTDGSGNYFFSFDVGYGKIIKNRFLIDGELSFGGTYYFTNYIDRRFTGDGYHIITSSDTGIGVGLNAGYLITKNINVFTGFNTIRKFQLGARLFFGN